MLCQSQTDSTEALRRSITESISELADVAASTDAMAIKRLANFYQPAGPMTNVSLRDTLKSFEALTGIPVYVISNIEGKHLWYQIFFEHANYRSAGRSDDQAIITPCITYRINFTPIKPNSSAEGYHINIRQHVYGEIQKLPDSNNINRMLANWLPNIYKGAEREEINSAISAALDETAIFMGKKKCLPLAAPVYFRSAGNSEFYGFDAMQYNEMMADYEFKKIAGSAYYIPWKSNSTGGSDNIHASKLLSSEANLTFISDAGIALNSTVLDSIVQIVIPQGIDKIQAVAVKSDSLSSLAGEVNIATYDKKYINLTVIPLNRSYKIDGMTLESNLNAIYKQAVVDWQVTLTPAFTPKRSNWDINNDRKLQSAGTGMLSNLFMPEIR